jgi:hypothetical protein
MDTDTQYSFLRSSVRVSLHLIAIGVIGLLACNDTSGPSGATLTFRVDPITCSGGAVAEITIDGELQGSYDFGPGAEWVFPVSSGIHYVKVQGEEPGGGFINLEREITVPEDGDFTVLLNCTG